MKKVLVVGGGFTGSRVAKNLEKDFDVTLIDTKRYFEFTPSILNVITNPSLFSKIKILHKDYLRNSKVIIGKANKISKNSVYVDKKEYFFDYLVLSSGSSYGSKIKSENSSPISRLKDIEEINKKIKDANKIAIVGGGLVAVELSSELKSKYDKKQISLFTSSNRLIKRNNVKSSEIAKNFLIKEGVVLNFNSKVILKNGLFFNKNKKINADYFFICTGIKTNSGFIFKSMNKIINKSGKVIVNKFLQVKGFNNIFSGGDLTSLSEEKTAQSASIHAKIISKNIKNLENSKPLVDYPSRVHPMVISLGRKNGIFEYKNFVFKGIVPSILKKLIEKKHLFELKFT